MSSSKFDSSRTFERFRILVRNSMSRLAAQYELTESDALLLFPQMRMSYRNQTTQVDVNFEFDSGVWVVLRRLIVTAENQLEAAEGYDVNYLVNVRAPHLFESDTVRDFDDAAVERVLDARIAAMTAVADDVLRGDFEIFATLKALSDAELAKLYAERESR